MGNVYRNLWPILGKIVTVNVIITEQTENFGLCGILQENISIMTEKRKVGKYSILKKTKEHDNHKECIILGWIIL